MLYVMSTPNQKYYSVEYKSSTTLRANEEGVRIVRSKLTNIPFSKTKTVLDVACGFGLLGKTFSKNVYGFDANIEAVKGAKKNGLHARQADAEKPWIYKDKVFDIVILSHIIEHVRDPDALILEAKRVLKTNGLLIVITPNLAAWFNRVLLPLGFQPFFTEVSSVDKTLGLTFTRRFAQGKHPVGHLRVFTLRALTDILTLHGFTIMQKKGVEFGAFPSWLRVIDRWIAYITPLSASVIVVCQKS